MAYDKTSRVLNQLRTPKVNPISKNFLPDMILPNPSVAKSANKLEDAYGGICINDNTIGQTIPVGLNYTKVTAFNLANENNDAVTIDVANNRIIIHKIGRYLVNGAFSFESDTNNISFFGAAFLDGIEQDCLHWRRSINTVNAEGASALTGIINVTNINTILDFRVRHDNNLAVEFLLTYGNYNVTRIGD